MHYSSALLVFLSALQLMHIDRIKLIFSVILWSVLGLHNREKLLVAFGHNVSPLLLDRMSVHCFWTECQSIAFGQNVSPLQIIFPTYITPV